MLIKTDEKIFKELIERKVIKYDDIDNFYDYIKQIFVKTHHTNKAYIYPSTDRLIIHETGNYDERADSIAQLKFVGIAREKINKFYNPLLHFTVDEKNITQLKTILSKDEYENKLRKEGNTNKLMLIERMRKDNEYYSSIDVGICSSTYINKGSKKVIERIKQQKFIKSIDNTIDLCARLCYAQYKRPKDVNDYVVFHSDIEKHRDCPRILNSGAVITKEEFKNRISTKLEIIENNPDEYMFKFLSI